MLAKNTRWEKIKIQDRNELNKMIQNKINEEESAILNKPEVEKTEEDKVFSLMSKAKKIKVQKTGLIDKYGSDIISETVE